MVAAANRTLRAERSARRSAPWADDCGGGNFQASRMGRVGAAVGGAVRWISCGGCGDVRALLGGWAAPRSHVAQRRGQASARHRRRVDFSPISKELIKHH